MQPCVTCGEVSDGPRCEEHRPTTTDLRGLSYRQRGYDSRWDRLSRRARAIQPFCSDCGTTERLTADHTPEAWRRKAEGLEIRLQEIDVLCNDCNVRRGSSRPGSARADLGAHPSSSPLRAGTQGRISDTYRHSDAYSGDHDR
jgi:5-methylcytosine-specific restriction protein A